MVEIGTESANEGDGKDRKCCSNEILGDHASTIVEEHLFILIHTTHRVDN